MKDIPDEDELNKIWLEIREKSTLDGVTDRGYSKEYLERMNEYIAIANEYKSLLTIEQLDHIHFMIGTLMQEETYPTREDIKQIIDAEVKNERQ